MIDAAYVQRLARYNRWQNENLYDVADRLSDEERRRDRGAFFGSIHGTLSHLLWGDCMWMSRFSDVPKPAIGIPGSDTLYPDWDGLKRERKQMDDASSAGRTLSTRRGSPPITRGFPMRRSVKCPGRTGRWWCISSITRPIIAVRFMPC